MRLGGRIAAAIEVLDDMERRKRPAADALKDWGLSHRFAGAGWNLPPTLLHAAAAWGVTIPLMWTLGEVAGLGPEGVHLKGATEALEARLIRSAQERTAWNKNRAAQLLQVNRTTLLEKIKKYAIEP